MRTSKPWNRAEFFEWLDAVIAASPDIKHVGHLAELAGMSHTTLSNWRRGVQRPTAATLAMLAPILKTTPRELWVRAGILDAADVGMTEAPRPEPTADWYEQMVNDSALPKAAKAALIRRRREEVAAEQKRAQEQIKLMEDLQS